MPKAKGSPKTGGRKKGTPNRRTGTVVEILEQIGVNPIEILGRIAQSRKRNVSIETKLRAAAELAQYMYPKRKAVEVTAGAQPGKVEYGWVEPRSSEESSTRPSPASGDSTNVTQDSRVTQVQ